MLQLIAVRNEFLLFLMNDSIWKMLFFWLDEIFSQLTLPIYMFYTLGAIKKKKNDKSIGDNNKVDIHKMHEWHMECHVDI